VQLSDLRHGHAGAYREWLNLSDVANSHPTEQVQRNTANVQPDGTNTASGVVQVDDSWAFGQVLSVVMIIANINEVLHFFFGFLARRRSKPARERQAQEEGAPHQAEGRPATPTYRPRGPYLSGELSSQSSTKKMALNCAWQLVTRRQVRTVPQRALNYKTLGALECLKVL
jgi:hypothetical protein